MAWGAAAHAGPDGVPSSAANRPPVADAGSDVVVGVGRRAVLDGRLSSDPDGDRLTYHWTLLSKPPAARGAVDRADKSKASVVLDRPGTYVATLTVSDGVFSATDSVALSTVNSAPQASAGPDQSARVGQVAQLDGSGSSDIDEDELRCAWRVKARPRGSRAVVVGADGPRPTFTPDVAGDYALVLTVSDGVLSTADTVILTTGNVKPVAAAGPDQRRATAGVPVWLDASGSTDADGRALAYAWRLKRPAGSTASLSDPVALRPAFTPDLPGTYSATLRVADGIASGTPDTVRFVTKNVLPVARAGPDQLVTAGATVRLDGSGSTDLDGQRLTYGWAWVARPAGSAASLSSAAAIRPTFVAEVPGTYVAQLVVFDGVNLSAADTVVVTTEALGPEARAGHDLAVAPGATVTLDGGGSFDPAGGALTYTWALLSRPAGSVARLTAATTPTPSFLADLAGDYVAQLTVTDGAGRVSRPDPILMSTGNLAPRANAGADQAVPVGAEVVLSAAGTVDPNGETPGYRWALIARPAGSAAALTSDATVATSFVADLPGEYVAQLIARDASLGSAPDTVYIRTTTGNPPVADAGPDQATAAGALVRLDGSGSFSPDGAAITYAWSLVSTPAGSTAALAGARAAAPTFTADLAGSYVIQLVVNDGRADSAPDAVGVTASEAGSVSVTPNPLNFADTPVGNSRGASVTVSNTGEVAVSTGVPSITGDGAFSTRSTGCRMVEPGASCMVDVTFAPTTRGARTATLNIPTSVGLRAVTLSGTATAASLVVISPNPMTIGATQVGSTRAGTVTLRNEGAGNVTVSDLSLSGHPEFTLTGSIPSGCGTLGVYQTCSITVQFAPTAVGARTTTLNVVSTAGTLAVPITATGQAPNLVVLTDNPMTIGATQVGGTRRRAVTLRNEGVGSVAVSGFSLSGDPEFTITGSSPSGCGTLGVYQTCSIMVQFAPTAVGSRTTTLNLASTAGPLAVTITATGQAASLVVQTDNPMTIAATQVGSTRTRTVTLRNEGAGSVTVSDLSLGGDPEFTIRASSPSGCGTLGVYQTCSVTVQFAPTAVGARTATLNVASTAGALAVTITATGQAPSLVLLTPHPLNLAATVVGATRSASVQVRNEGVGSVTVTGLSLGGDPEFTLTGSTPPGCGTLGVYQACTITVQFAPTVAGARTTTLTVTSNAPPVTVVVNGTGI
jgi:hypothetical protein